MARVSWLIIIIKISTQRDQRLAGHLQLARAEIQLGRVIVMVYRRMSYFLGENVMITINIRCELSL